MTQEELDALMSGELDDIQEEEVNQTEQPKEAISSIDEASYNIKDNAEWPPPPPNEDHKVVHQLDDVTRDSEIKATEIFDKLESINNSLMELEEGANQSLEFLQSQEELLQTLMDKFPNIEKFKTTNEQLAELKTKLEDGVSNSQMAQDEVMMIMDIMQYQDIHRQKIERVINVMRALSKYMNSLFEGKIDDEKRVSSAVHIQGDTNTEDVVSNEDIEALIASLGK